jgi:hypothetical protein
MNRCTLEMLNRLQRMGISLDDALALRRISMTLQAWHEAMCGLDWGHIEQDENGRWYGINQRGARWRIADREKGARKRLDGIMARYPELRAYVQGDPRGAALYVYRADALGDRDIYCCYGSISTAVYK